MIEFQNVSKTFVTKSHTVNAVRDVSFKVEDKEIFGVIGYSGAGKSTLVRCINFLERPTSGSVVIGGTDLGSLKPKQLREKRTKIGMIFQGFNLMGSRTVFENVAFPLRYKKKSKQEINNKVYEILELVGITEKASAYPSQLSGGQKQRVAIARALANDPDILLCDEATSALDPQTTKTILKLLKEVNEKLGITIVIITHEMNVIKEVCDRVAVMEDGEVKEIGRVVDIFANPQASITKDFIQTTTNYEAVYQVLQTNPEILNLTDDKLVVRCDFKGSSTKEAIISQLSQKHNVEASIVYANVELIQNEILGTMVIVVSGESKQEALQYLKENNVRTEVIEHGKLNA